MHNKKVLSGIGVFAVILGSVVAVAPALAISCDGPVLNAGISGWEACAATAVDDSACGYGSAAIGGYCLPVTTNGGGGDPHPVGNLPPGSTYEGLTTAASGVGCPTAPPVGGGYACENNQWVREATSAANIGVLPPAGTVVPVTVSDGSGPAPTVTAGGYACGSGCSGGSTCLSVNGIASCATVVGTGNFLTYSCSRPGGNLTCVAETGPGATGSGYTPPLSCGAGLSPVYWGNNWTCLVDYSKTAGATSTPGAASTCSAAAGNHIVNGLCLPLGCNSAGDYWNFACQPTTHYEYQLTGESLSAVTPCHWYFPNDGTALKWNGNATCPNPPSVNGVTLPPPNPLNPYGNNSLYAPGCQEKDGRLVCGGQTVTSNPVAVTGASAINSNLSTAFQGFSQALSNISSGFSQVNGTGSGGTNGTTSGNATSSGSGTTSGGAGTCAATAATTIASSLQTLQGLAGVLSSNNVSQGVLASIQNLITAVAQVLSALAGCISAGR